MILGIMAYKNITRYLPEPTKHKPLKKNFDYPRQDQEIPWPKDIDKFEPDVAWPDGMAVERIARTTYRERLTGIILKADWKPREIKSHKFYPGQTISTYDSMKWRLVFPNTGVECRVKSRHQGMQLLWEIREAMKRVMERYFVNTRSPDGRIRSYMVDPNPVSNRPTGGKIRRLGAIGSPVFLACV